MGKGIQRQLRKNRADEIVQWLDTVLAEKYTVRWLGKGGITERDFDTYHEAAKFNRRLDTAGSVIIPHS